jgi:DNA-binding protein HU-beta
MEIVNNVAAATGMQKKDVENVVNGVLNEIETSLSNGENVYLRGLGTFKIVVRAKHIAQNIRKRTSIVIPAHKVINFLPSRDLTNNVSQLKI